MKIIIAGAGAMGSRFGIMLHRAGNEVTLVDGWKEHVDLINSRGLKANLNGEEIIEKIPAIMQNEIKEDLGYDFKADLVIFFTKAMQLEGMINSIKPLIHDKTYALCLLNGLGHEEVIEKYLPRHQIIIGNTIWTSTLAAPGEVTLFGDGSVNLKNVEDSPEAKQAAENIAKTLSDAGLKARYADKIFYSIYKKACVNGTMNGLCTILDCDMATLGQTKPSDAMVRVLVAEFIEVAAAEHVEMNLDEIVDYVESCFDPNGIGHHHPSMHQDLIGSGRLTEIDYINGAIARKGKKYGIKTPYCDFLTSLVHAKEQILGAK